MQDQATFCNHCGGQIPAHTEHECAAQKEFTERHAAIHAARAKVLGPKDEGPGVLSGMTDQTAKPSVH